jgi:hypothetical protein
MIKKIAKEKNRIISYVASSLFHLILFILAYFFTDLNINKINPNAGYVQVFTKRDNAETVNFEKVFKPKEAKKDESDKNEIITETEKATYTRPTIALNFIDRNADTTSLEQVYSESTLNVSMKYPSGWTFIDQNVNNKLDGVTFWANISAYNPPPYVHLQVCDKALFNPNRYKHNLPLRDATLFFNDPENLANYVSQTFYFRTENSEDFSLKLTIKGEEAFKTYAPTFYGMLKSFRFGGSIF